VSELLSRFDDLRRREPTRPLIHLPAAGSTLSAAALWDAHRTLAARLAACGVSAGRLVVSAVGNSPASVELLLACRALRAALMPVDGCATPTEIRQLAERFRAAAVALPDEVVRTGWTPRGYFDAAVLKVTSGSTGEPKATLTTEPQLVADATHIVAAMDIRPSDVQIAAIPVSHSYGLGNLTLPLLMQGTAFVLRESFIPQQLPGDAARYGARVFPGVPFMFEYFLANPPADGWPPTLRRLISAGAPLAPATVREFHARFGVKIHAFYGSSETGGISFDDADDPGDAGTVGKPLSGVSVTLRIADCGLRIAGRMEEAATPADCVTDLESAIEQSAIKPQSAIEQSPIKPQSAIEQSPIKPQFAIRNPQSSGRIHVVSDAVSSGYADGDAGDFIDGGFLTGDYGAWDACHRLTLVGRASSFVNVAGKKVQPGEVELVLREMAGIADARVVAAPDARRGQQLVACLVATRGAAPTALEVRRHCAARLAPHKIPRAIVFLDAIPVTARGKTDREALDDLVRARIGP
jgi:acyl-CoA synthetase (AMP-forming)/AMP-acid ligase II